MSDQKLGIATDLHPGTLEIVDANPDHGSLEALVCAWQPIVGCTDIVGASIDTAVRLRSFVAAPSLRQNGAR
jgi:hypothetical protein